MLSTIGRAIACAISARSASWPGRNRRAIYNASAEVAISAAESAVWEHEAQRQAAAKEKAERPWLVVHFAFRGPGGQSFAMGRQQIDEALADVLREWRETMEAQAELRGWEAPSGYSSGNWPPFTIEEAGA